MPKVRKDAVGNNAVIYCRVSTKEQARDNASLETQEKSCREDCLKRGLVVDRVFIEGGASAKTTNRKEFIEMISYCFERKAISALLWFIPFPDSRVKRWITTGRETC